MRRKKLANYRRMWIPRVVLSTAAAAEDLLRDDAREAEAANELKAGREMPEYGEGRRHEDREEEGDLGRRAAGDRPKPPGKGSNETYDRKNLEHVADAAAFDVKAFFRNLNFEQVVKVALEHFYGNCRHADAEIFVITHQTVARPTGVEFAELGTNGLIVLQKIIAAAESMKLFSLAAEIFIRLRHRFYFNSDSAARQMLLQIGGITALFYYNPGLVIASRSSTRSNSAESRTFISIAAWRTDLPSAQASLATLAALS